MAQSAVYSSDGKRILSAASDDTIKEWDIVTGKCIKTYEGHSGDVNSALYSSDGKKILSASSDKTIKEWDIVTGKCIKTFHGHSDRVYSAVYSSDGKRILSASNDGTIKEWDTATGECLRTMENVPWLVIQGCSFRSLHPKSDISEEFKKIVEMYNAIIDELI